MESPATCPRRFASEDLDAMSILCGYVSAASCLWSAVDTFAIDGDPAGSFVSYKIKIY